MENNATSPGLEGGFVQRPWPERSPEASPFLRFRALCIGSRPGSNLPLELTAAGLPCQYPDAEQSPKHALEGDRWDLVLWLPGSEVQDLNAYPHLTDCIELTVGLPMESSIASRAFAKLPLHTSALAILQTFGQAQERHALLAENQALREELGKSDEFQELGQAGGPLEKIMQTARAVADTKATVLLLGESGTGKTRLASALHRNSSRKDAPFQVVHCGALPSALLESELFGHAKGAFTGADRDRPGRFEEADGGTIFLDEVQSAPLELQVKLLRVLQEKAFERVGESKTRRVDVRILAASNRDLEAAIEDGEFREDLYWRLNVVSLTLPPLRDRPGDLAPLVERFLKRFSKEYDRPQPNLLPGVWDRLLAYAWPGNIRQLENVIERAVLLSGGQAIGIENLPNELLKGISSLSQGFGAHPASLASGMQNLQAILPLKEAMLAPERAILMNALRQTHGNRSEAAKRLGINRTTLFNKMNKHGLMEVEFDAA